MGSDATKDGLRAQVIKARDQLVSWLLEAAYPLWSTRGIDMIHGGFHESLTLQGNPTDAARRARVQPRQIFAFSKAHRLGWKGNAFEPVSHGVSYFLTRYRRPDGLFRTLVAPDGAPLDHRAVLYDQAFALLSFSVAGQVLGPSFDMKGEADKLRSVVDREFHRAAAGFNSYVPPAMPLQSNPHMHLFEASLEWLRATGLPVWRSWADEIGELALKHFIDATTGALRESFDDTWTPMSGVSGRIVEPGHQFEWAWLLLNWNGPWRDDARKAAVRLIEVGETYGIRNGLAVNALLDDFSIHDGAARLWVQTERLRAAAIAARVMGDEKYWKMTVDSAAGLMRYFEVKVPGIWHDLISASGDPMEGPVPAGNLYHIVGAIEELITLLKR
jgi:mannose/cellobiose epimerase-like protein (N-acyl-D-glucosamine 2-epimerase family)